MFGYHTLRREQTLPGTPDDVFPFFADAGNLEAITPPWLGFRIVTPRPIEMGAGTLIEYRLQAARAADQLADARSRCGSPACASSTSSCAGRTRSGTTRTSSSRRRTAAR